MKNAVVTGASGGMGAATVNRLAGEGYRVFGMDVRPCDPVEGVTFIRADLTNEAEVLAAFEKVKSEAGSLDCIVNMAGMYDLNSLVEMGEEDLGRIFNVNLFAACRVNRIFLPLMQRGGRIIVTASELAPLDPLPFTGVYAITKSALEKYACSLRMELQLIGIDVIVLRPGAVDTGLLDVSTKRLNDFCENTRLYRYNAKRFKSIVDRVEARKVPPERVAALVSRALDAKRPKLVYKLNRNPLLLLLNILPAKLRLRIIKSILLSK